MSNKADRAIAAALGLLGDATTLTIESTTTTSGLLLPDEVYRMDASVDMSLVLKATHDGDDCNILAAPTLYKGKTELLTTPKDTTGAPGASVHFLVSGISEAGVCHATRKDTPGK